jgi:hypothetical protein
MKTKDFIKLLQEEDPTGECHIRINGEPIWFLESKPGYWDGPYNYLKRNDKEYFWVQSTESDKIDVRTMDMFSFCEWYKGDWEQVKKHIKVEYSYLDKGKRKKDFIDKFKQKCWEFNEIEREIETLKK